MTDIGLYWKEFLIVAGVHLLAVMSPGPDLAVMIKTAVSQSRRSTIFTALGIGIGIGVHVAYCLFGIAVLIAKLPWLFLTLRYLGALYLIYLGITCLKSLRSKFHLSIATAKSQIKNENLYKSFRIGFLTNVLNPKATLFFLSLFTQVIDPHTPIGIQLLYGIEMIIATFSWFAFVGIILSHRKFKSYFESFESKLIPFMGIVLILLGLKIAFSF